MLDSLFVLRPIVILIVDDNRPDIRIVREVLKNGKLIVDLKSVENGEEAMAFLRKEGKYQTEEYPDLILLDLRMPKKDGFEVLEEIKSDKNLKDIPVIIMTISKDQEDVLRSYHLQADAYIIKPVELNQFINAVKSIQDFWLTVIKLSK